MGWSGPVNPLVNYEVVPGYYMNYSLTQFDYFNDYLAAFACNQRDDCGGFVMVGATSGWFLNNSATQPGAKIDYRSDLKLHLKKSYTFRKASQPDTSVEGVIASQATKATLDDWTGSDRYIPPGYYCCGQAPYADCNKTDGLYVPLGHRLLIMGDGLRDTGHSWIDKPDQGYGVALDQAGMHRNFDDCVIVENVGFDVSKHWYDMVDNGVNGSDVDPIKQKYCDTLSFTQLQGDPSKCQTFYTGKSGSDAVKARYLELIKAEKPNNWPDDPAMLSMVLTCMVGNGASATTAKDMLGTYCLITNPNWPDNQTVRTFVNNLIQNADPTKTNQVLQQFATDLCLQYCRTHGSSTHCAVWNAAVNLGYNGCGLDVNKDVPGCRGLYDLKQTFRRAIGSSPDLATVITPIENAIKPLCFTAESKAATASPSSDYLRTGPIEVGYCNETINLCLQNVTVGGDMKGTLRQSCNIELDVATPNTGGIPTVLQTTTDAAGGVTVNNQQGPDAAANAAGTPSGVTSTGLIVNGQNIDISKLLVKPGKYAFVDKYLPTPEKQKGALGGIIFCIICCCCLMLLMIMSGGDETPMGPVGPSANNLAQERLGALLAKI
jgi:hypothetical protein